MWPPFPFFARKGILGLRLLENLPIFHDEFHLLEGANIGQRVGVTAIMSARLPGDMEPRASFLPRRSAAQMVAD